LEALLNLTPLFLYWFVSVIFFTSLFRFNFTDVDRREWSCWWREKPSFYFCPLFNYSKFVYCQKKAFQNM